MNIFKVEYKAPVKATHRIPTHTQYGFIELEMVYETAEEATKDYIAITERFKEQLKDLPPFE